MKCLLFGLLCGFAVGCNTSPPASTARSTTDEPTTVTVQRPITTDVTTDGPAATTEPVDRTNTGVNIRDRDSTAKTPFDQNENKTDVSITAEIRSRVVETKMSVNAQNVKIITQDGMVTLRGPVQTEQEKQRIEEIAKEVAGADKVSSQLEVNKE